MSPLPEVQVGSEEPLYNIGVVSRMTGLSMATLRAWERRYEFPEAQRTAGGHRLFSERDVMRLRWVKARIDEGMQTAQAIHALRHQEESGHLVDVEAAQSQYPVERGESAPHLHVFQDRLYDALVGRDVQHVDILLGEALAISTPEDLILEVIGPAISRVGEAWEKDQISVATEHLATNYLRQRMLMWMLSGPPPRSARPIVLACAPNEWHEGSLLMLGALLRRRRWPVAYLGQALPLQDLAVFVRDIQPPVVVLVAMTEESVAELIEWPQYMPDIARAGRPTVTFGGRVFTLQPEWRVRMSGIYLGDTLRDGLERLEGVLNQAAR